MRNDIELIEEVKKHIGYDLTNLYWAGAIAPYHLRKWFVKEMYWVYAKEDRTFESIKEQLEEEYGISVSAIEKLIYKTKKHFYCQTHDENHRKCRVQCDFCKEYDKRTQPYSSTHK